MVGEGVAEGDGGGEGGWQEGRVGGRQAHGNHGFRVGGEEATRTGDDLWLVHAEDSDMVSRGVCHARACTGAASR